VAVSSSIAILPLAAPAENCGPKSATYRCARQNASSKKNPEYHWLEGQYDRLPALVADLVRRRVAIIATPGGTPEALADLKAKSLGACRCYAARTCSSMRTSCSGCLSNSSALAARISQARTMSLYAALANGSRDCSARHAHACAFSRYQRGEIAMGMSYSDSVALEDPLGQVLPSISRDRHPPGWNSPKPMPRPGRSSVEPGSASPSPASCDSERFRMMKIVPAAGQ
jgi:hypothetical protein